jgi:hypothetical protein
MRRYARMGSRGNYSCVASDLNAKEKKHEASTISTSFLHLIHKTIVNIARKQNSTVTISVRIAGGWGVEPPPSCLLNPPNKMPWDSLGGSVSTPPPPRRC